MIAWLWALAAWAAPEGTVTVPVADWQARQDAAVVALPAPRQVALGRATWSGEADPRTLALSIDATLEVTLTGSGWSDVPLLGTEAVLTAVDVDGAPVAVDQRGGSHVWPTQATGQHRVRVRALVPASGQRGAVEYDFGVPQTAATRVALTLPRPDLAPEIGDAVRMQVQSVGETTRVTADLAPTSRIRLLGLKDLGPTEAREAKLYAESAHLLAVDERRLELFSVVRWTILYAATQSFEVFVPEGLSVVSADGEGAFAWEAVPTDGGTLVRGETAYPIRNRYEVSLRLSRELPTDAARIALPHAWGVEREHGWVGIEAPGRVRLEEVEPEDLVAVDPNQLPDELRRASVSPLLYGLRSHGAGAVRIRATPLPEVEVSSEHADRVVARTVVSASGRALTELSVTLRNRLRHALLLELPEGAEVTRAFLDGEPVVPSRTADGRVAVPLRRSAPDQPFQVLVVLSQPVSVPRWLGRTRLALPALDLPVTALRWEVALPDGPHWSGLHADVDDQEPVGSGHWLADAGSDAAPAVSAPSQVETPEAARVRAYRRHWVPARTPVTVTATASPRGLRALAWLTALLGAAAALALYATARATASPKAPAR
ncbi:MAG: hypothetical protein R3F59_14190 [Myxococcota bacterium]